VIGNFISEGQERFLKYLLKADKEETERALNGREIHKLTKWEANELINIIGEKHRQAKERRRREFAQALANQDADTIYKILKEKNL
jgi:hypothetical protein